LKLKKDAFNDNSISVPFVIPMITKEDKIAINNALNSVLLTDGPKLIEFEKMFSKYTNSSFSIGVSNATSALMLSLKSCRIGKGDEVIVPDLTFVATASAVIHCGATPILADVEEDSMNLDPSSVQKNLTKKTKAIIPVHFAGKICKIREIIKISKENDLKVIEDCAHALGSRIGKKHAGTFGDVGCFSFYPTKNFTTIEGGMIITNSKQISDYTKSTRNHGITKTLNNRFSSGKPWEYDIEESGFNFRLDEIRSALGLSQMKRLDKFNDLRKKASEYYTSQLSNVKGITTPMDSKNNENSFHLYIIRITKDFPISRDILFKKLLDKGIRTSVHYKPLNQFSLFKKMAKSYDKLKISNLLYDEILSLPMYPTIKKSEQNYVIDTIKNEIKKY
jgi:perosamine synthetase